jgi:hypothetical protein
MEKFLILRDRIHQKVLDARKLEHLMGNIRFEEACSRAKDADFEKLDKCILELDANEVTDWIEKLLSEEFATWPVLRLRKRAKQMGVPRYGELTRSLLLSEICKRSDSGNKPSISGNA